ncbi:protein CLEC16A homolog isoform X2 [Parasteatoda tepidariorum]|uniref:protein CLEC16A homolog isoform X2 n=1 Tax=Parasteatoda tepidariorum TaxID=114398 RepID=UPI0039BC6563
MFRGKGWFSGGMWKPKNPHSLEHLKYLYHVLYKNQTVNEQNKSLLVETLRSIAEILIWGDQNDSTVFDFFLEKNMLSFFLKIMKQKCGRYVCVQLLQTLNILFENIRNETSLYYLLSNNHVNSIIVHKFDFSDEEVMAYYISFLKTLSLKLNTHTIHFFYNEHTNDFPLYNEAIKFFKHSESMVRIAVRTLTLNVFKEVTNFLKWEKVFNTKFEKERMQNITGQHMVYNSSEAEKNLFFIEKSQKVLKVDDKAMLKFIRDKTAAPYFSNLVYFIGQHVMELDKCVKSASELQVQTKLADLVAEHLDHLHYLNDILCLHIEALNDVLTDHLLNKLLVPLYVYSLVQKIPNSSPEEEKSRVSPIVSLFLLSQAHSFPNDSSSSFSPLQLLGAQEQEAIRNNDQYTDGSNPEEASNLSDEEKVKAAQKSIQQGHRNSQNSEMLQQSFSLTNRPFLEAIFSALDCSENDHATLFSLCVLYALGYNPGISQDVLDTVLMPSDKSETKHYYNVSLAEKLIQIINLSCQYSSKIRIATLQMTLLLLKQLALKNTESCLLDCHLAAIEQAREESTVMLRNFYKSEEIFLDMFEDEYEEMKKKALNVEYLMMDEKLLLPPTGTPMSGIEFHKRLPCGEVERARRAIRVFFLLRDLSLTLQNEPENQLPLTNLSSCIKVNDALDLNNSDLISCTVITKDGQKIKGFMVIDALQLILVDPDNKRVGWGIAKFVGFLQDIEVTGDKDDSRCLHITIHRPSSIATGSIRSPLLAAKFVFDDHIRCMAAKQRLSKGRQKARQRKLHQIARLLELPDHIQPCPSPLRHSLHSVKSADFSSLMHRSQSQDTGLKGKAAGSSIRHCHHRPLMSTSSRVPGHATILKHGESSHLSVSSDTSDKSLRSAERKRTGSSPSSPRRHGSRSRESSPRQHASSTSSEEIPLEDLSRIHSSRHGSPSIRRRSSSGLPQARISAPPGLCHLQQQSVLTQSTSSTTSLNDKLSTPANSERASISNDELFCGTTVLQETSEPSTADSEAEDPKPPSESDAAQLSPSEVCTKPCCAAEQSSEKVHPSHSEASVVAKSKQESEVLTPQNSSSSSKIKGAIQTV